MRVFIDQINSEKPLSMVIEEAIKWIEIQRYITPSSRIFIKPNLTWKKPSAGVTVTPIFLRELVKNLLTYTNHIMIGESDGGQGCFRAEEAFQNHGLYELQKNYGIQVINLSKIEHELASAVVAGKRVMVNLPSLLLHDVDVFITVPVPKIHAMTGVSLGFKNQWGCLGDKMRVKQHPHFDSVIIAIHKLLKPKFCIFDGTYFLDGTGPMMGEPVLMNLVIAGDDVGAASLACCSIMQIDPFSISHHRLAQQEAFFPNSLYEIEFNRHPGEFVQRRFQLKRAFINYIHLVAFHNVVVNRMFYDSIFADALHEFLWLLRRSNWVKKLLYGKFGTGEANRGGRVL